MAPLVESDLANMTTLRSAPGRAAIEQWALVLSSQGIDCAIRPGGDGWILVVDPRDGELGANALDAYDLENRDRGVKPVRAPEYGSTWSGVGMALLIVAFHFAAIRPGFGEAFFRGGSASAELILRGEWWRTVTALTLHADMPHLLANALSCALFATGVCRAVGPGAGAWLMLLSGALGNALTAFVHGADHVSVGASTAIFGAVGLLAGRGLVSRRSLGLRGGRAFAPIAAGLALLAMLGTGGARTDLWAHIFGLVSGTGLGVLYTVLCHRPAPRGLQLSLLAGAFAALLLCWAVAFASR